MGCVRFVKQGLLVAGSEWYAPAEAIRKAKEGGQRTDSCQASVLVLLFINEVPCVSIPSPVPASPGHPLPHGERAVIMVKTAHSLWERGDPSADGWVRA